MNRLLGSRVRSPTQAGRFYPGNPARLQADVSGYLAAVSPPEGPVPKALIAPHAGYVYSGPIAATAFVRLAPAHDRITRVCLVGPSHYAEFEGIAASSADAFASPLGTVPLDAEARDRLLALPQVRIVDEAHEPEHALEVELPFLQTVLDRFAVTPLLVGHASPEEVAEVLAVLWGGDDTCVVVSSDLSHYLDAASARRKDRATAGDIEALRWERLDNQCACGHRAIGGLLALARARSLRCEALDLRHSGDTGGSPDRVVGYGAFGLFEAVGPGAA